MGAVFGSYCVDLKLRCGKYERSVPRLYAFSKLFLEDIIQAVCQILFIIKHPANEALWFVVISIFITVANLIISLLNIFITAGAKPSRELLVKFEGKSP